MTRLEARGVGIRFGTREVLREVAFTVEAGSAVAIVGANGAGKTTLLKVLAGLQEPSSGEVRLGGASLGTLKRREVARQVAVVPQSAAQVFGFTLLEFVLMGFHARTARFALPSKGQVAEAEEALERMELGGLSEASVAQLSGGELQRALLARALVARADIWLLDEPTASLDMRHQVALLREVEHFVEGGGAVVAVLHDLALVHRFFDRALVLQGGEVAADGPPGEVLTEELVSRVYGVPMRRADVEGRVVWVVS